MVKIWLFGVYFGVPVFLLGALDTGVHGLVFGLAESSKGWGMQSATRSALRTHL